MDLNLTFSVNYEYMNELITIDLKENGRFLEVNESNKNEFVELVKILNKKIYYSIHFK
jgi:hypothetical protein